MTSQDLTRAATGSVRGPPIASNGGGATDFVRTNTLQGPKPPKEYDETIIHKVCVTCCAIQYSL